MNGCPEIRDRIDAWLDREVSPIEADLIARHVETCAPCAQLAAGRRDLRKKMRAAFRDVESVDPHLKARLRARIADSRETGTRWRYLAIAAMVLLGAAIYGTWRGPGDVMEVGLRQHVHCAINRTYPAAAPAVAEMTDRLGAEYAGLLPVVEQNVPKEYRVVMAHRCTFKDRAYIHVIARDGSNLISLLITRRDAGEAFENDVRAVAREADSDLYSARSNRLSVAGFETSEYLVYLVSNMDESRNLRVFQAMMPGVKTVLG
ncbi:MAG: zf-HC2 domain-containing protein [Acidobacteriota bacterium]|nr:zf-HC2 domain-containing protein [Acidobacteriota bacterium]